MLGSAACGLEVIVLLLVLVAAGTSVLRLAQPMFARGDAGGFGEEVARPCALRARSMMAVRLLAWQTRCHRQAGHTARRRIRITDGPDAIAADLTSWIAIRD